MDAPAKTSGTTPALVKLCHQAAKRLEVLWPTLLPHQHRTRLVGNHFLPKQQATVRHKLPVFPDFMTELMQSWASPKAPLSLPFTQFSDLEDMEPAGLAKITPMDETLAVYLAPKPNMSTSKPTLTSMQCCHSCQCQHLLGFMASMILAFPLMMRRLKCWFCLKQRFSPLGDGLVQDSPSSPCAGSDLSLIRWV